jgi:DNA repair photolyase
MVREIIVKTILNKSKKRDTWFLDDYTFNPYQGCSFNCLYCYIRGSKYGMNMDKKLSVKVNAIELLEKQLILRAKKKQYGFIVLSSATDPYLKIEQKYRLTRKALELIAKYRFPVHMITKSDLITRDFDLLKEIHQTARIPTDLQNKLPGGTIISFSFSTLDDKIAAIFEPGAPPPSKRIVALQQAIHTGFHTGVSMMPLLPFITDNSKQLDQFFQTFRTIGVKYILPATLTLFGSEKADSKTMVLNAIKKHYPHLEKRYQHYFDQSSQMPAFYKEAFYQKMNSLSRQYNIHQSILQN